MTKLIAILLLTCTTAFAQSVIVKGTGAGSVRGTIAQTPTSVLTNLFVTGTLDPDVTGTNYVQITDNSGASRWQNTTVGYYVRYDTGVNKYWLAPDDLGSPPDTPCWERIAYGSSPTGTYSTNIASIGVAGGSTGTPTIAYWYQTNFASTVSVKGTATP